MGKVADAFMKKRKQKLYTPPDEESNELSGAKPVTTVMIKDDNTGIQDANNNPVKKTKAKFPGRSR